MKVFNSLQTQWKKIAELDRPLKLFLSIPFIFGMYYAGKGLFFNFYILEMGFDKEFLGLANSMTPMATLILAFPLGVLSALPAVFNPEDKNALELHEFTGEPYYLGAFLIGAYQEILGDLHNLLGDTHAVHVKLDDEGRVGIEHVIPGDTARDVLDTVQYSADSLVSLVREEVAAARERGLLTSEDAELYLGFYESSFGRYTYLE